MYSVDSGFPNGHGADNSIAVVTYRLDVLIELLDLDSPTHIKMDVDGGEAAVSSGSSAMPANPGLTSVHAECTDPEGADSTWVAALEAAGFSLISSAAYMNCLFERETRK